MVKSDSLSAEMIENDMIKVFFQFSAAQFYYYERNDN